MLDARKIGDQRRRGREPYVTDSQTADRSLLRRCLTGSGARQRLRRLGVQAQPACYFGCYQHAAGTCIDHHGKRAGVADIRANDDAVILQREWNARRDCRGEG